MRDDGQGITDQRLAELVRFNANTKYDQRARSDLKYAESLKGTEIHYINHQRGEERIKGTGEAIRSYDFRKKEDREAYEKWNNSEMAKRCGPDERLHAGYWTSEGYHQSYCASVYNYGHAGGDIEMAGEGKCPPGQHWVEPHDSHSRTGRLEHVKGYCAHNPTQTPAMKAAERRNGHIAGEDYGRERREEMR